MKTQRPNGKKLTEFEADFSKERTTGQFLISNRAREQSYMARQLQGKAEAPAIVAGVLGLCTMSAFYLKMSPLDFAGLLGTAAFGGVAAVHKLRSVVANIRAETADYVLRGDKKKQPDRIAKTTHKPKAPRC